MSQGKIEKSPKSLREQKNSYDATGAVVDAF
jgi:hypothetical protein